MRRTSTRFLISALLAAGLLALTVGPGSPLSGTALAGESKAPKDAHLYIGWPNNGERVRRKFRIWFGLRNMGVSPAGIERPNTGHHHLIIDRPLPPMGEEIPNDKNHLHFGAGQTEAIIELPPGKHTLQLLFADHKHVPHNPPVISRKITVHVR